MNATDLDVDLELVLSVEDLHCQSGHIKVPVCSVDVEYIVFGCDVTIMVCRNAVEDPTDGILARMSRKTARCKGCKRHPTECWNVRPV